MPFIGRLDRQVDDLIISPVSKRRRDEGAPELQDEGEPASPPPATTQTPRTDESSAEPDELPVWLL